MPLPYVYKYIYIYIDVCPKPHAIKIDGFSLLLAGRAPDESLLAPALRLAGAAGRSGFLGPFLCVDLDISFVIGG